MVTFEKANPLCGSLYLKKVVMRFYRDAVVPVIDEWGSCVGIVHRDDCTELNVPLSRLMRGPPPCVTTSTSVGRVIELLLEKKYKMVIVVRSGNLYETNHAFNSRPVGVFTFDQLSKLMIPTIDKHEPSVCRTST
uniref:Pentatricopeptide repeat-containing protein At5g10690 n=2 Tax=Anthurium amnicola TaxID=1678845 RepID=A0A1D1XT34_9ARAE